MTWQFLAQVADIFQPMNFRFPERLCCGVPKVGHCWGHLSHGAFAGNETANQETSFGSESDFGHFRAEKGLVGLKRCYSLVFAICLCLHSKAQYPLQSKSVFKLRKCHFSEGGGFRALWGVGAIANERKRQCGLGSCGHHESGLPKHHHLQVFLLFFRVSPGNL